MKCACGRPLHYLDPHMAWVMRELIQKHGEYVKVLRLTDGRAWMVQRHYIALHGIRAEDLGTPAVPGFEEVLREN